MLWCHVMRCCRTQNNYVTKSKRLINKSHSTGSDRGGWSRPFESSRLKNRAHCAQSVVKTVDRWLIRFGRVDENPHLGRVKTRRTLGRARRSGKPSARPWEEGGVNGTSRREIELQEIGRHIASSWGWAVVTCWAHATSRDDFLHLAKYTGYIPKACSFLRVSFICGVQGCSLKMLHQAMASKQC